MKSNKSISRIMLCGCLCIILLSPSYGQEGLVASAKVTKVAGDFTFTEGPVADALGNIFFSDIPENTIYKWFVNEENLSVVRMNSGGANGLFFDDGGNLITCEGSTRQITSMNLYGEITVIAREYDNGRFNRPNDLWIDPEGGIYFTDPAYSVEDSQREQEWEGVYYITPDRNNVTLVSNDLSRPNGLIGTPSGKKLYITDHGGKKTWIYDIKPDGTLDNKRLLAELGADGMTLDEQGNIYLTNPGNSSVNIYNPEGKLLESISIPEGPSNITFGGPDKKILFITARTSLYALKMQVRGL